MIAECNALAIDLPQRYAGLAHDDHIEAAGVRRRERVMDEGVPSERSQRLAVLQALPRPSRQDRDQSPCIAHGASVPLH